VSGRGRPYGWRAPDPHATMVNVRLTDAEVEALDVRVTVERTSRSAVLRAALQRYLHPRRRTVGAQPDRRRPNESQVEDERP